MVFSDRKLIPDADARVLNAADYAALMAELPHWRLVRENKSHHLQRRFIFDDYSAALTFTGRVGDLAIQAAHSPAIITASLTVTIIWGTRRTNGLLDNDFILAAKTDQLYQWV